MSYSTINRVILVGRLTRDPELRSLPSGTDVCDLRIACNSSRLDAEGARREYPNYFDVNVYGASAESVARYTRRGSRVGVDGRLEWREWQTDEQQRRQSVSVVADRVQFLDGPSEGRTDEPSSGRQGDGDEDGELLGAEELEVSF